MKKLLFALAGTAAFAAFAADPAGGANDISLVGFESYTVDQTVIGYGDNGESGGSLWTATGDDASVVKAYGGDNATAPSITEPRPFAGETNTKYLALDTNGSELQRDVQTGGSALAVAADGTYIDTLVQFTPSESAPTAADLTGAKLAIWLGVVNNVTNLYVAGGAYSVVALDDDDITVTAKSYKLSGTYEPGAWYRLTVKAIKSLASDEFTPYSGFQIFVDGTLLTIVDDQAYTALALEWLEDGVLDDSSLLTGGTFIPSADTTLSAPTLTTVGFKGTGALDDFVVTTEAPDFTPAGIDFTLTWDGVTPVSYAIDGGTPVSLSGETSPFAVPGLVGGETVAFTFQNADGATKTMSTTAADDGDIDAGDAVYTWADYLGEAVNGAYTIDDANDLDMLRKGVAANLATLGETFKQTANIDMTSAGAFAGIGTYAAAANAGLPFEGTYDGQGFTISNITFTDRDYAGVFNQVKGGTIKDLTVDTITFPGVGTKCSAAIVGNAGLGTTLQGLTAAGSFGTQANPAKHNVAGIAIRLSGGASNVVDGVVVLETLVKDCTNNATLYGNYTKAAGITALTQDQNGVPNDYVLFDGCVNNGNIVMVTGTGTEGRDGVAGIVGYVADGTKMQNCVNNGTLTSVLATAKIGELIGWAQGRTLEDLGGNAAASDKPMIGSTAPSSGVYCQITGFQYATVANNNVATTVLPPLAVGATYLLEGDVTNTAAVATLTAVGDTIAFDEALGYTFAGTVASSGAAGYPVASTSGTVTTYSAGYFPRTATPGQDGSAANPFEIADVDDLQALAAYTAGHGLCYIQTADINMATAGTFPGIGGDFTGTYDGDDYTISNIQFEANTYRGLFNKTTGATIKNLTIDTVTFATAGENVEFGGSAFVGKAYANTVLSNLTAKGSIAAGAPCNHSVAGIATRVYATGVKFFECSNEASVYGEVRKVGGILGIIQGTASVDFVGCSNSGTIVTTTKTHHDIGDNKDYTTGADGLGGIIAYANAATTLKDCSNTGAIQTHPENTGAAVGGLIGKCGSVTITDLGGNSCAANMKMIGVPAGTITGFQYATVDAGVATTTDTLATNNTFLLERNVAAGTVFTLSAEGEWIEFDTALGYTFAGTVGGENVTNETTGTVIKYWIPSAAPTGWVDDPTTVTNVPAATAYPDLAGTALATADAGELTTWAKANSVSFNDAVADANDYVDAFLLNCAVADVDTEKDEFVLNITFDGSGNPVVTTPDGKDYNGTLQMKGSNDLSTWYDVEEASSTYKFYKAVLSL